MNLYREDMLVLNEAVRPLRSMADELRAAMEEPEQFRIRYQPIVESKSKKVEIAKALLRWKSPVMGDVLPGRYIAVAEQNGLIRDLTKMVLRKVCEDLSGHPDLSVSVNISPLDLLDPAFADEVGTTLAEFGVRTQQIVLELTEKIAPEDEDKATQNLKHLRDQGYAVAVYEMDDGFGSFGFLKMPGYTLLKIEKELLDEVMEDPESRQELQSAITASKEKGFMTLAIGVEDEDQADLVEKMGFDLQQGFFHSELLSLDELLEFSNRNIDDLA